MRQKGVTQQWLIEFMLFVPKKIAKLTLIRLGGNGCLIIAM